MKKKSANPTGLRWLWVTLVVLVLDRITKYLALQYLPPFAQVPVTKYFNLTLAYNKGAAFSFLSAASGWQGWLFGSIALVVSIGLFIWLARLSSRQRVLCIALALVMGGALGNVCDRFLYGYVIDFLDFYVKTWHWPAFNIADSAVCLGAFLLFFDGFFPRKNRA